MVVKQASEKASPGRNTTRSKSGGADFRAFLREQQGSVKKTPLYLALMGLEKMTPQKLREQVERGLEYERLEQFRENADLTNQAREALQARVEKLHRTWTKDRNYLAPPASGKLAELDPALVVAPPPGLEIGYVPIVTRQAPKE